MGVLILYFVQSFAVGGKGLAWGTGVSDFLNEGFLRIFVTTQ